VLQKKAKSINEEYRNMFFPQNNLLIIAKISGGQCL